MLGAGLAPALLRVCGDALSNMHWFRTDWQRGGALTAYAKYDDGKSVHDVVVKFPVPPRELHWLRRLQASEHQHGDTVPRLLASGEEIEGYDLAWVIMERLPHGPLDSSWQGAEWDLLVEAIGRFYAAADQTPVDQPPRQEGWPGILKRTRAVLREHNVPEEKRWSKAIKLFSRKLGGTLEVWDGRDTEQWCHGDLHLANAMTRSAAPSGPALLFDLAEVHAGHWVEDAVYLEHLYWAAPDRLGGRNLVKQIARERKARGLKLEPDWPAHANARRALLAASAPAYLRQEGNPRHLHAALERLEQATSQLNV
jgi:aminoglycoside phosphotransferase (APT) family kinase protein